MEIHELNDYSKKVRMNRKEKEEEKRSTQERRGKGRPVLSIRSPLPTSRVGIGADDRAAPAAVAGLEVSGPQLHPAHDGPVDDART
jgi:hypothetical protein